MHCTITKQTVFLRSDVLRYGTCPSRSGMCLLVSWVRSSLVRDQKQDLNGRRWLRLISW